MKHKIRMAKIAGNIFADYDYIYDPQHEKNPGGGYQRTEKGWSQGVDEKNNFRTEKKIQPMIYDFEFDKYFTMDEMKKEFEELKKNQETEAENFQDYIENITGKDGTCKIVKK